MATHTISHSYISLGGTCMCMWYRLELRTLKASLDILILVSMPSIAWKGAVRTRALPGLLWSLTLRLAPTSNPTLVKLLSATLKGIHLPFTSLILTESSEQIFATKASVDPHHAENIMWAEEYKVLLLIYGADKLFQDLRFIGRFMVCCGPLATYVCTLYS